VFVDSLSPPSLVLGVPGPHHIRPPPACRGGAGPLCLPLVAVGSVGAAGCGADCGAASEAGPFWARARPFFLPGLGSLPSCFGPSLSIASPPGSLPAAAPRGQTGAPGRAADAGPGRRCEHPPKQMPAGEWRNAFRRAALDGGRGRVERAARSPKHRRISARRPPPPSAAAIPASEAAAACSLRPSARPGRSPGAEPGSAAISHTARRLRIATAIATVSMTGGCKKKLQA
jgi:hypothetical protein